MITARTETRTVYATDDGRTFEKYADACCADAARVLTNALLCRASTTRETLDAAVEIVVLHRERILRILLELDANLKAKPE